VTIYIPDDRQISDVVQHVTQEHSEAANIKSKQTRTAVQDALTSIKDRLRYFDTFPPDNGIVLFRAPSTPAAAAPIWSRKSSRARPSPSSPSAITATRTS